MIYRRRSSRFTPQKGQKFTGGPLLSHFIAKCMAMVSPSFVSHLVSPTVR